MKNREEKEREGHETRWPEDGQWQRVEGSGSDESEQKEEVRATEKDRENERGEQSELGALRDAETHPRRKVA